MSGIGLLWVIGAWIFIAVICIMFMDGATNIKRDRKPTPTQQHIYDWEKEGL